MPANAKIGGNTRPQHRSCAEGEDQKPPNHSHNVLGYQNAVGADMAGI